jgi:2-polyprenyl-3-methyl-5-hydroxy-6-metoxy-1,4-benzoquinol methylase
MSKIDDDNINVQSDKTAKYNSMIKNKDNLVLRESLLFESLVKTINHNVIIDNNSSILEVGFNDGTRLKKISSFYKDAKVIGLEVRQECVDNLVNEGFDCRLVDKEIFDINERFDIIYGYNVIHHLSIPYEYLRHLYSLLNPGGVLIFPHESYSTHLVGYILNTITGNWKYEMNIFKLSRRKIIKDCIHYSKNFQIGYNGMLGLYSFPRFNKIYHSLYLHKLPFINDLSILIKKDK